MTTYSFSYSVIASDTDVRAATPIDNDVTVSGSHTHTPPTLSPFTSGLGFGGSLSLNMEHYSGNTNSENVNAGFTLTFGSTTWSITGHRIEPPGSWIGFLRDDSGTFRTGTSGTVEVNVSWSASAPSSPFNTSGASGTSGWVPLGSEGAMVFFLDVLGDAGVGSTGTTKSDSTSGTLSVSMRYVENNAVSASGSQITSISLSTSPGLPP